MKEIETLRQDMQELCADMDRFCEIYREDSDVWQGEAATEEASYISSDIDAFRRSVAEMNSRLEQLSR